MTMTATPETDDASLKGVMLRGAWYYAAPAAEIARGRTVHKTLLG